MRALLGYILIIVDQRLLFARFLLVLVGVTLLCCCRCCRGCSGVCVCVSNPVSKDTTLVLVLVLTYPTNFSTIVQ